MVLWIGLPLFLIFSWYSLVLNLLRAPQTIVIVKVLMIIRLFTLWILFKLSALFTLLTLGHTALVVLFIFLALTT